MEKMKKKGMKVQAIELSGRKIADSFWGKGWCDHIESFSDYVNRLPRGRTYIRNGSVCHLEIKTGRIEAIVSGSSLYNVAITISPLALHKWKAVKSTCCGRIGSLIDLLRGKLDRGVMEIVSDRKEGLFPLPGEIKFTCDCPDWAGMCKHVAAVLYGVGARLDHAPEMLFQLRGVNHEELVDISAVVSDAAKAGTSRRRIAATGLADVFGIEITESGENSTVENSSSKRVQNKTKVSVKPEVIASKNGTKNRAKTNGTSKKPDEQAFPDPLTGETIAAWRASLAETQYDFADRLHITAASISSWEKKGKNVIGVLARTMKSLRKAWELTHS
jgi:uncharacterized Zn finger protein/DNA-binding XRE family transcriptional regulator